jgi:hypothetical protein
MKWHVVQQIVRHDDEMTTDRKAERGESSSVTAPEGACVAGSATFATSPTYWDGKRNFAS